VSGRGDYFNAQKKRERGHAQRRQSGVGKDSVISLTWGDTPPKPRKFPGKLGANLSDREEEKGRGEGQYYLLRKPGEKIKKRRGPELWTVQGSPRQNKKGKKKGGIRRIKASRGSVGAMGNSRIPALQRRGGTKK